MRVCRNMGRVTLLRGREKSRQAKEQVSRLYRNAHGPHQMPSQDRVYRNTKLLKSLCSLGRAELSIQFCGFVKRMPWTQVPKDGPVLRDRGRSHPEGFQELLDGTHPSALKRRSLPLRTVSKIGPGRKVCTLAGSSNCGCPFVI